VNGELENWESPKKSQARKMLKNGGIWWKQAKNEGTKVSQNWNPSRAVKKAKTELKGG